VTVAPRILDRLEHVKQTGLRRWVARCSAHEDRSPSLSTRELDDGRVLLHDFGGCETEGVLAALGSRGGLFSGICRSGDEAPLLGDASETTRLESQDYEQHPEQDGVGRDQP
jgi:hypothetical protein